MTKGMIKMNRMNRLSQDSVKKINVHKIIVFFIGIYMLLLPFEYVLTSESGTINNRIMFYKRNIPK